MAYTAILLMSFGCNQMSEQIVDETAGDNGGFEVVQNGLPVNWLMYTPNTVPEAEFNILLDTVDFQEGSQSLKFKVERCSNLGGWKSPGFTNEFNVDKGSNYNFQFWIKNTDAEFKVMAGGVSAMEGNMKTLVQTSESFNQWKQFDFSIPISEEYTTLRIEVNILKPGTFWIDNIKIQKE